MYVIFSRITEIFSKVIAMLQSDKAKFVYGLFKKWYILAAGTAVVVTGNVLWEMGHNGSGPDGTENSTLDKIYKEVENALSMIQDLSTKCPALIEDLGAFFDCIGL